MAGDALAGRLEEMNVVIRVLAAVLLATAVPAVASDTPHTARSCGASPDYPPATTTPTDDGPGGIAQVAERAQLLFFSKRFADLDELINRYGRLEDRFADGRFKLVAITVFLDQTFGSPAARADSIAASLEPWTAANPKSAGAAIATAAAWRNAAARVRGLGYSNNVTPEGAELAREFLQRALTALKESEAYAARNPLWYGEYMEVNKGLDVPLDEQLRFYEVATKAFPSFFPLHFVMIAALSLRWHGTPEAEAAFIDTVISHAPPKQHVQLYARLWWFVDSRTDVNRTVDIFRDMGASWPRMRQGFESLMRTYPDSPWNRSHYAAFACEAGDTGTYVRLRAELGDKIIPAAFPGNASIDVCDVRAGGKAT